METEPQRRKRRDNPLFSLNAAIGALDLARQTAKVVPIKDVFDSASVLLNTIKVRILLVLAGRLLADGCRNRRSTNWILWKWG